MTPGSSVLEFSHLCCHSPVDITHAEPDQYEEEAYGCGHAPTPFFMPPSLPAGPGRNLSSLGELLAPSQ